MKKTIIVIIIIALAIAGFLFYKSKNPSQLGPREELAQCLADKGVQFWGAYWCPHCNNQKLAFGRAGAKKLPYNECALYPTEVSSIKKSVLEQYNAGTYTGGYLTQLNEAKAANTLDAWEPEQTEACVAAEVKSYPTWIFPDGSQLTGEVALEKLAEQSQCDYVSQ